MDALRNPTLCETTQSVWLVPWIPTQDLAKRLATALIHIIQHKGEITTSEPWDTGSFLSTQEGSMTTQEPKKLQR